MNKSYSRRVQNSKKSFIREMLQLAQQKNVISFAGGLPNAKLFPIPELQEITANVLQKYQGIALQYNRTEGFYPLRQLIADIHNTKFNLNVKPENFLVTSGSQQGIDLIGRLFLDPDDDLVLEEPSYVGAIEAFAAYEPRMTAIPLEGDGINLEIFEAYLATHRPKLFYTVPTFQNPSGSTYSLEKRQAVARLLNKHQVILVEDDPYRELRFSGQHIPPISSFMDNREILLGSCSKIIVPGIRVGSIMASREIIERLTTAKQATDVHSSILSQILIYEYLTNYNCQNHINKVKEYYQNNGTLMVAAIKKYFPSEVKYTTPGGGMFIWVELPASCSSLDLFNRTIARNVAFVPGDPFFLNQTNSNCFRLSYCNSTVEQIDEGIKILGESIRESIDCCLISRMQTFH